MNILSGLNFFNKRNYIPAQPKSGSTLITRGITKMVSEEEAMTVAAFNRGVMYIATQLSKLPWEVKNDLKEIQTRSRTHNLINKRPNDENNIWMARMAVIIQAIVSGNGYFEIERDFSGRPVNLWPMMTNDVQMIRGEDKKLYYLVSGGGAGTVTLMPHRDVLHFRNLHTYDGFNGTSVVDFASETLGISHGANTFANSLFANSGMPSGAITIEGKLSLEAIERLKEGWKKATSGRKTGSVVVLENGAKFEPITFQPDVLQFIESRKFGVPEIARFLGVSPQRLFDLSQSTYNNNEQSNLEDVTGTIGAWTKSIEAEIDFKLLDRIPGHYCDIDMFEITKGDMATRSEYYKDMMSIGSMTPNEVRSKEGMPSYQDGDMFFIATNNYTPANRINEVIDSQINKAANDANFNEEVQNMLKN